MEIGELVSEAERSLRSADPLCIDANAYYAELRLLVEQSIVLWARILFLHAAQQDQLQSLGNVSLVIHSGVEKAREDCEHRVKTMKRSRVELRTLLATLKQTNVDEAFHGHSTLYQYVHEGDVSALETQVDLLADQLLRSFAEIEGAPDRIKKLLAELRDQSSQLPPVVEATIPRKMAKLTSKATPYANDMANLLTALTSHYDLCSQIPQLSPEEASEAIQVAMGDREQVIDALERLKECRSQLKSRHRESQRLQHSLAMSFETLKGFEDSVSDFISNQLRPVLLSISEKHSECRQLFLDVESVTAELNGLTDYYRLFKRSYHALIIEIARRKESSKHLSKVVENANNALSGFISREHDSRQTFLDTYHEYLPRELWPNMADMPREYKIILEPEQLPDLTKAALLEAMKDQET